MKRKDASMMKLMRRSFLVLMTLIITFLSTTTAVFAETDTMQKSETNKLKLYDTIKDGSKKIEETIAAGKSITYKVDIPKGNFHIELDGNTNFEVRIYDSKNKVVKKIESYEFTFTKYMIRFGIVLNKGKYKIKITNTSKESELNINGLAAMIRNSTSITLDLEKEYNLAVTKGKTYKWKFEVKEEDQYNITSLFYAYDSNSSAYLFPDKQVDNIKIVNSKGEKVVDGYNLYKEIKLKKGTYTITFKASTAGYYTPKIHRLSGNTGWLDSLFNPDLVNN